MELIQQLGIDWRLIIAQIVNFLILLAILYKFVYKPVVKILDDRKDDIARGMRQADESKQALDEAISSKEEILTAAKRDAQAAMEEAKKYGENERARIIEYAKTEADQVLVKAKDLIMAEKKQMIRELKAELHEAVAIATEKVASVKVDAQADKKIIEDALSAKK